MSALTIAWLFDHFERFDLSRPSLFSAVAIAFAIAIKWKLRRSVWLWITLTVIVVLHVVLIFVCSLDHELGAAAMSAGI